jgi:mono/diheme cytochrome c family protein
MRVSLAALVLALGACDSGTDERRDVSSTRAVMRPHIAVPPGTVPRGASEAAAALLPPGPPVTEELLRRGEQRFTVFCTPCHGYAGRGDGIIVSRGFPRPPSYHDERLRAVGPEHIVGVITNGAGRMYSYADRVPPAERWAIAHHVKALQARAVGEAP